MENSYNLRSLSARRAWIEISIGLTYDGLIASLSARRAWIEIITVTRTPIGCVVALRKESVDRNITNELLTALKTMSLSARRAWIEIISVGGYGFRPRSLSARRAWIEIHYKILSTRSKTVALRKESVDRNTSRQVCTVTLTTVALRKESVDRNSDFSRLRDGD